MAGKTATSTRIVAPASAGLAEYRRRTARQRPHSYWVAVSVAGFSFMLLLLLVSIAVHWMAKPQSVPESITSPAAPGPSQTEHLEPPDLPVIRLSNNASDGSSATSLNNSPAAPGSVSLSDVANPYQANAFQAEVTELDEFVRARLAQLGIQPAPTCSDSVFVRRAYLDVIGTLPTANEARSFIDEEDPGKRARLIDELLQRPEFADYQAMRWCDILRNKAEFPINLWPNAAQAYHRWIRTAIRDNMPYDEFVRELLTASGSNFRTPQVNFYRAMQSRDPESTARAAALAFMGERAEQWPKEQLANLAVFFQQVEYKPTGEWKEQIVMFKPRTDDSGAGLGAIKAILPDGTSVAIPEGTDPRVVFADWLIDGENPRFTRPIANRVWGWLLGIGIVEPIDEFKLDNPPRNPPLLDYLARELVESGYDLRHLYRLILNSATYQQTCVPTNTGATQSAEEFATYPLRRLDAEVIIDAICKITGTTETYSSMIPEPFTFLPDNQRAIALPDGSITSPFLEMFGRPARDTGLVSERNNRMTAAQALHLLNSNHIRQKIERGPAIRELIDSSFSPDLLIDDIYLTVLSRRPTTDERITLMWGNGLEQGYQTIIWALINSEEFLFRH